MGLESRLQTLLEAAETSLTPQEWLKRAMAETGLGRRAVKAGIDGLVRSGDAEYVVAHGRTCVQSGFQRPVAIGRRVVLAPPGIRADGDAVVRIRRGASFGTGAHPTTRLCIRGIETVAISGGRVLDVGCGSGVLMLSAIRLGMTSGIGVDTDPVAVNETRENIALNQMEESLSVCERLPEKVGRFDLVVANLRTPTLNGLSGVTKGWLLPGGHLVLSGMKSEEVASVRKTYVKWATCLDEPHEKGWGSLIFRKNGN